MKYGPVLALLVAPLLLFTACGSAPASEPNAEPVRDKGNSGASYPSVCLKASDNVGLVDELVRVRAQIEQRLELGDELGVPREIDHSARFRRPSDARDAASDLRSLGYRVQQRHRALVILHRDAVDLRTSRRFTCEVYLAVDRHRGDYEGWGSMVVEGN